MGQSGQDGSKVGSEASRDHTGLSGDVQELHFHLDLELAPYLLWVLLAHLHLMGPHGGASSCSLVMLGRCRECRQACRAHLTGKLPRVVHPHVLSFQAIRNVHPSR